jgi:2-phosphoglycerate kinase
MTTLTDYSYTLQFTKRSYNSITKRYLLVFLKLKKSNARLSSTLIILLCGYPRLGKTTLANKLGPLINAVILSTDKIRK